MPDTKPLPKSKQRGRSPNYPSVDLEKALVMVQAILDLGKGHPVGIANVHQKWGYTPHGSVGNQAVAALKAYGLITIEGQGKSRKLVATDAATRIVGNAPHRAGLLKQAAISPPIHRELWEMYSDKGLPDDSVIATYLQWERPEGTFHAKSVGGVVARFRSTIEFSGLETDGIIETEDEAPDSVGESSSIVESQPNNVQQPMGQPMQSAAHQLQPPMPSRADMLALPIIDGSAVRVVNIPKMSQAAFDFLMSQLKVYRPAIVESASSQAEVESDAAHIED